MVQRFDFCQWSNDESGMQAEDDGEWVKYEDYAALEDKLAAMQGLLLAAQDFAEFCRKRGVEDWGSDDN
jgi:hypothetical protein